MEYLGQYFLKNQTAINKIIAVLNIQKNETIIEIGPGRGELTFSLLEECARKNSRLIAIEKDAELSKLLSENAKLQNPNFKIINADVLKILPELTNNLSLDIGHLKLVGNIPYYITGKLLRTISGLKYKPILTVLMIQKEVAERIIADPPKNNLLASAVKIWAEPKIIFKLKPADFSPAPKVDSAVIKLETRNMGHGTWDKEKYYELIHIIFKQPRKTLINNLKKLNIEKDKLENIIESLNLPLNCRPQDLSIENILKILKNL